MKGGNGVRSNGITTKCLPSAYLVTMDPNKRNHSEDWRTGRRILAGIGIVFVVAGATKLLGWSFQVEMFGRFQFPAWWFLYAVGAAELLGGVLLILGRRRGFAVALLSIDMLGAIVTRLRLGELWLALLPLALLVLLVVFWDSRDGEPSN